MIRFIATEVIEHLDEETLDQFGNAILDKYKCVRLKFSPRVQKASQRPPCFVGQSSIGHHYDTGAC